MDAQTAVWIHTDNRPEMTHLAIWIPTDNNTIRIPVLPQIKRRLPLQHDTTRCDYALNFHEILRY